MTDKEKIHQILSSLWKNDDRVDKIYYNQALQDVQIAIDLQEEPVSEDLEEAVDNKVKQIRIQRQTCEGRKQTGGWYYGDWYLEGAKFGAQWKEEQMMAKAIDVEVKVDAGGYPYIPQIELYDYNKDVPLAKEGDKYKVVLIKED